MEMTHPLSDELVKSGIRAANHNEPMFPQVARFGADWQLEKIVAWGYKHLYPDQIDALVADMRPIL